MKTKILMVCLGNICRSPLAEGILKAKTDPEKVFIDSAGTGSYHVGGAPDKRSIAVGRKYDIDITGQKCRQFDVSNFEEFDHIFVMDNANYRDILSLTENKDDEEKVQLILNEIFPGENVDVPDPYHGGDEGFENVYQMLEEACESIALRLDLK
ncbi:low molecular weight protein-tyrosine-phosphatase [Salegentibacter sp. F188]|uniref:protein-tyrosine-phosphatase n=1 Tax=Autumnicola patrickiae TaxID=3075591 RepID=A0ABU3DZ10_9FLAO|nr:low molecular weight protein-tyrosine-phosphatase [Salegentibacter sp. F188]MDT0688302.1 low molecular weight protein-tyrosine-phosphatase [Salegentibacter sp. F188]